MAKGFKDEDGKFHPTENKIPKSAVKSSDIRIEGSKTNIDPLKAEELKTKKTGDDVNLYGEHGYWRLEKEGDDYNLSLDDPMGWHWSGEKDSLLGFLARINGSKVKSDFLTKSEELDFEKIKKVLIENADDQDALYEVTGDNNTWGRQASYEEQIDSGAEFSSFYDTVNVELTKEQKEKLEQLAWNKFSYDYDDFVDSFLGKESRKNLQKIVKEATNFEDLFDRLDDADQGFREDTYSYISGEFLNAIDKSADELGIKHDQVDLCFGCMFVVGNTNNNTSYHNAFAY